jgi:hypothetical protein
MDQNENEIYFRLLTGLIILIAMCGCSSSPLVTAILVATSSPLSQTPRITSPTAVSPAKLSTQTAKLIIATLTPSKVSTSTSTLALTQILEAPSPTLGPTLAETDKEALVLDLLQNNAGCELPCWWGFTPGLTTWETARDFFLLYGENINPRFKRQNAYISGFVVDKYHFSISVTLFIDKDLVRVINIDGGTSPGIGKLIYGDLFFRKAMQQYTLSRILSLLGKPEQILILVDDYQDEYTSLPDYHILLFYPEKGILAEYEGRTDVLDDKLQICPANTMISIWLWSSKESLTLEDIYSLSAGYRPEERKMSLGYFRPWEEISGKSINDFITTFKVQNACFDTPAALWGRK